MTNMQILLPPDWKQQYSPYQPNQDLNLHSLVVKNKWDYIKIPLIKETEKYKQAEIWESP